MQRLRSMGVSIEEFPQTSDRLTRAGNALFDAFRLGRLVLYESATELRQHTLNASARETARGVRLVKRKSSQKVDAAISLAMSVCVASEATRGKARVYYYV
jgi:phage terminase large subunit-like protein